LTGSTRHLRLKFDNTNDSVQDEVWILLTRHVADTRRTSDFTSLRVQLEDDLAGSAESADSRQIATKVEQVSFIHNPEAHAAQGMYTNSTHVLVRASPLAL
jgi:calpain-7